MEQIYHNENKRNKIFCFFKNLFATIGVFSTLFFILISLGVILLITSLSSGIKNFSSTIGSQTGSKGVTFSTPIIKENYIAAIQLNGEINSDLATHIIQKLNAAKSDEYAKGILFEVNSPGGSVVPSQEIYETISQIKKDKPVVVYVREMAASGAYYSSASASKIIANRGSMIGSIGVIIQSFDIEKLIQSFKVNPVTLKTGELKDAGSIVRSMNDKDKQYLSELIETIRKQFVNDVQLQRKTSDSTMKYMSDGRVVLGSQAVELKLIDAIGTKDDALNSIISIAKLDPNKKHSLFYYDDIQSFSELLSQKISTNLSVALLDTFHKSIDMTNSSEKSIKLK